MAAHAGAPAPPLGPFNGLTVVDLTRVLAGPYCTMILSDLGARVIKVERPDGGDDARAIGPFINGVSAYFASLNRGKESVALDLKAPADRARFEALLDGADLLVENYRPGTMEGLGYGWEDLHARWPGLIYAAVSGFGHSGPLSRLPAYDMVVQAMGGIMSITGQPGGAPTRVGSSIGDITAGLFTAVGVGAALHHRTLTGEGMKLDVAMLDCQVAILENALARYAASGEAPGPLGARHPSITPFAAFRCADGHVVIAAGNDRLFASLCATIGRPELVGDPRYASNDLRTQHQAELAADLEDALCKQSVEHWVAALTAAEVPNGPINDVAQVINLPQTKARNMAVTVEDAEMGTLTIAGNPIKMSAYPDPQTRGPIPRLGGG
ncbi:MAG: CaiB/BaiF CoA transferase family protein [Acidimicrobiales bacterium]